VKVKASEKGLVSGEGHSADDGGNLGHGGAVRRSSSPKIKSI